MNIEPQYNHSKFGNFLFNLCAKWTKFIIKHKWLYYFLACTWGILLALLGVIITIILSIVKLFAWNKIKFEKYNWIYLIKVGPDWWGGFETGLMFIRDHKSSDSYINCHEFGHTIQNTLFGPFTIFLVTIPSAIRYWWREIFKKPNRKPYDSFWAEDSASRIGTFANSYINNNEEK